MSKSLRVFGIIFAIIGVIVLIGWGAYYWFTRQALPKTSGTLKVAGLQQTVEIVRDEYGVPHIYAQTAEDLFFAEGFVHAQERFYQMDFQRRIAAGRLSELFGEASLGRDRYLRQFNFPDLAEQSYAMLDPESKRVVDAYSQGVNAYITELTPAQLSLEFAFLGLQGVDVPIESWTPADSLVWAEMMMFDQSDQMRTELRNLGELENVGTTMYADLHPEYRQDRPTIIQPEDWQQQNTGGAQLAGGLSQADLEQIYSIARQAGWQQPASPALADLGFGSAGASNSFVVSGKFSGTGMPLLANDPHMGILMPALWYQVGMHCVEKSPDCIYNFRGGSLPGVPGILIGNNDRIAWGLTNAAFDAEDVFIERINPDNPDQYEVDGKWVDMELRREEIVVRGREEPVVIYVRSTRNGLVGSDVLVEQNSFSYEEDSPQFYALSYAWPALQPVQTERAVLMANRAQNWDEFVAALEYFAAGKQNWLYADIEGNIGYVMPGQVPIRPKGDGTLPVPGWNDEYRWKGFIPYSDAPKVFNPGQGYIIAANNLQLREADYPYLLGKSQDRGQRAWRLEKLILADTDLISLEDAQAFQTDNQSVAALEYISYLKALEFEDQSLAAARDRLLEWDGQMTMDSPEAALYAFFWKNLVAEIFKDKLAEDQWPGGGTGTEDVVYFLLQDPDNDWWDKLATPDVKERRDAVLKTALQKAVEEGSDRLGENLDEWRWGDLHTITFQNATLGSSGIGFIERIFNRGPFPVNGSETVIQKTCWSVNQPFETYCIPALRQVVDLSDLSNNQLIHSVGQSGHPASPHYDDFIDLWRNFEYIPANWLREQAEAGKHDTLTLQPK